jgi:6-pyruvoyltetrahydropterin/6-carboxytetrahydropterin synthase
MYQIAKRFRFSASHQLFGLPETHKCARLHGHNYEVEVVLEGERLGSQGFVRDYADLDRLKEYLNSCLDHRHLNEVLAGTIGVRTTAEVLAEHLYQRCKSEWPETVMVKVSETPDTWASYGE